MRHNRLTRRFGRNPKERKAMMENMVSSLLTHQQITTTLAKAKEARKLADRLITLGKEDTLHARRQVFSYLQDHKLTSKVFKEVAPRFKSRKGGYTRILQLDRRKGDGTQMALLELTEKEIKVKEVKAQGKKAGAKDAHAGHDHPHEHETREEKPKTKPGHLAEKEHKKDLVKPENKQGFFKNLSKFFKNKGGG